MVDTGIPDTVKTAGRRKVFGVPVILLAAVVVAVLVIVAWKTPKKVDTPVDTSGTTDTNGDGVPDGADGSAAPTGPAFGMTDTGSFTSAGAPITVTPTPVEVADASNQTWLRKAIEWLVETGTPGGAAQEALTLYLNGQPLSYAQGQLRDKVIKQFGPPPEGVSGIATTASEPGRRQGPPPLDHTVKGANDNQYGELATLYYGHNDGHLVDILERANADKIGTSGPFPPGTKVTIPKYHPPMTYKATASTTTAAAIAKKNGTSEAAVKAMNGSVHWPVKVGTVVIVG